MNRKTALCTLAALLMTLCSCSQESGITWEALVRANTPRAMLDRAGAFSVDQDSGGGVWYVREQDGGVVWSYDAGHMSEDYRSGALYRHGGEGVSPVVSLYPTDADPLELFYEHCDLDLSAFEQYGAIRRSGGKYRAKLRAEDEEYGVKYSGSAEFDEETLLLDSMKISMSMGFVRVSTNIEMSYGEDVSFEQRSYRAISGANDAIGVTLHEPGGGSREYSISQEAELDARHTAGAEEWSLCWDEQGTGRIDDLAWVDGSHADLYLVQGSVPPAPPSLERVIARSGFHHIFKENYDSYGESFTYRDAADNWLGGMELAWIQDEDGGMRLYVERVNADGEVTFTSMGEEGVWYSWTEQDGYRVDFMQGLDYAERYMWAHSMAPGREQLQGGMQLNEYGIWCIPYTEEREDGSRQEYIYAVAPSLDYVDHIDIRGYDAQGVLRIVTEVGIGGNGGIPVLRDIEHEISSPQDADTIRLRVMAPSLRLSLNVRSDAAIGWEGMPLYRDRGCTLPVTGLEWVEGGSATVYAK